MSTGEITVSGNEIAALLRRVFEALFAGGGDYEAAAQSCLWLEQRGLEGCALLVRALPSLREQDRSPIVLLTESPQRCVIDAAGGSLLQAGIAATDLAIAGAAAAPLCHVTVMDCQEPIALLPCVARCGRRGLAAAAWWVNETATELNIARVVAGEANPDWFVKACGDEPYPHAQAVNLICASDDALLLQVLSRQMLEIAQGRRLATLEAAEFRLRRDKSRNDGMVIAASDYRVLCSIADEVLVEASEASRCGAGE